MQCLDDIQIDLNLKSDRNFETGNRVIVIGATNTPWMIDGAFLRSGRFDRVVHVGLPSTLERESILHVHISRMRVREGENTDYLNTLCKELSALTKGFSGADISGLCRAAAVRALEKGSENIVEERHFREAMGHDMHPTSDDILVERLKKWRP